MRSERKKGRAFLARFMVLLMIINLLSGINPSAVRAAENSDFKNYLAVQGTGENEGIIIKKEVTGYNNNDTFNVKLTVEGSDTVIQNNIPLDIVLVVDTSGSMAEPKNGWGINTYEKINKAKSAAKNFVDTLIPESDKGKINIGVISFAENGIVRQNLTQNTKELKGAIDKLKAVGGTYTQEGLEKAANMLKAEDGHKKVMIVISDGEPTFAKGKHPNFGEKKKRSKESQDGFYKVDFGTTRDGYEQWYGNAFVWKGRGHNRSYRNYLVKSVYGEFGDGTLERNGWGIISWPYNLMDSYFKDATVAFARTMNKKIQVFSIGIGLTDNHLAKEVMNEIATNGKYMEAGTVADELSKILKELAEKIQKRVHNGVITDPMSEQVEYVGDIQLAGTTDGVKTVFDNNTLKVSNINLGKGEKLEATYKVKLKKEWKDGKFHKTNGITTLKPYSKGNLMEFNVPEIRANVEKISITVNKEWKGPAPEGLGNLEFTVTPSPATDALKVDVFPGNGGKWTGKLENLPKYKDGKEIEYEVTEVAGNNYKIVGNIEKNIADNGDLVFTATNKNTEKVTFSVKKEWGTTPTDLQFPAKVRLYKNDVKAEIKAFSNNEVTFTDLDKYDASGNEIKYTVKEVNEEGTEEKDGKITNKGFYYTVSHTDGAYVSTITNTCTNPQDKEFTATITKKWKGGIGKEVTFLFNDKNGENYGAIKLERKDNQENTWTGNINLAKYNDEGKELTYVVTEKEIAGFTSDNQNGIEVSEEKPNATFINTRNTIEKITVTKVWENTPEELKTAVKVNLYKNGSDKVDSQEIPVGQSEAVFRNLPETDEDGTPIHYTFKEDRESGNKVTLGGKEFDVKYDYANNTITNTYTGFETDKIKITIKKDWTGDTGKQAEFVIKKGADEVAKITLPKDGDWTGSVVVDKWEAGSLKPAKYTVEEKDIKGFTSTSNLQGTISREDKVITFTNAQIKQKLTIKKEWVGTPTNAAFTLTYRYNDEDKSEELTIPSGKREVTKELPVYDLNEEVITYTVTESKIEGYQADLEKQSFKFTDGGLSDKEITFKNTEVYTGAENTYTIIKNWKDQPADSAYFGLFDNNGNRITGLMDSDGTKLGDTIILSKNNVNLTTVEDSKWTRTINLASLPKVYADGKSRTYEFKEMTAPYATATNDVVKDGGEVKLGNRTYKVTYVSSNNNIFEFTNTDVTKANITVTKRWVGKHQPGLKVGLFNKKDLSSSSQTAPQPRYTENIPGEKVEEIITFSNINLTDDLGKDIDYVARELDANNNIIKEDAFELGNRKYEGSYDDARKIITNTELIDITVNKKWDNNVPESERQSVDVQLYDDDGTVNRKATLTKDNNWEHKFEHLPYTETGYSVKEININGRPVEELGKLFKIEIGQEGTDLQTTNVIEGIKEATTITIKNSLNIPEPDPNDPNANKKIKVIKYWETNATHAAIKVAAYSKVNGEWELQGATDMNGGDDAVWEGEITPTVPASEYYVLETSVDGQKLTDEEINNLLDKLETEGKVEYQIGDYDVLAQRIPGTIDVLIKNMSKYKTTRIMVTKDWTNTPESYRKPVTVKLYKETTGDINLKEVAALTITEGMGWTGCFNGIPKLDDTGAKVNYHVAEVGIGEFTKDEVTLAEITDSYTIGTNGLYKVQIEGDGSEKVTVKNDIERVNIEAEKLWAAGVTKVPVEFTLYSKKGETFKPATGAAVIEVADTMTVVFTGVPKLDEAGNEISYYVFETKIGNTAANHNYSNNYTVKVPGGTYTVTIAPNGVTGGTDRISINNAYTSDSTGPVVPSDTPDTTPSDTPDTTPDTTPTDTPSTTPTDTTVDVPDDTTPQGDANINIDEAEDDVDEDVDDTEDEDVLEVDNDDVPQGDAKTEDAVAEDPIDIDGDSTPRGPANLPKTGSTASDFLSLIGMGLIGLGLVVKKRK